MFPAKKLGKKLVCQHWNGKAFSNSLLDKVFKSMTYKELKPLQSKIMMIIIISSIIFIRAIIKGTK